MMSHVSVIIPAHNAAAFIGEAIASALNQTYRNVEIIVVNDGSTDDTLRVLAPFADRIALFEQSEGCPAKARNRGARAASGSWLAFLDADDVWLPHKLERQLSRIEPDTVLVYSNRYNIGTLDGLPEIQSDLQPMYEGDVFLDLLLMGNVITTSSVLVRRDVFNELGGFSEDPAIPLAEDWDLWIRVAAEHPIAVCAEPLVKYRLHPAGASHDVERMNQSRSVIVERALTLEAYSRARLWWPFDWGSYKDVLRVCLGRY